MLHYKLTKVDPLAPDLYLFTDEQSLLVWMRYYEEIPADEIESSVERICPSEGHGIEVTSIGYIYVPTEAGGDYQRLENVKVILGGAVKTGWLGGWSAGRVPVGWSIERCEPS